MDNKKAGVSPGLLSLKENIIKDDQRDRDADRP
jgi:hypothetical protein